MICRGISLLIWVISIAILLKTLLITTHETPKSTLIKNRGTHVLRLLGPKTMRYEAFGEPCFCMKPQGLLFRP